jgi:hypothetical protein
LTKNIEEVKQRSVNSLHGGPLADEPEDIYTLRSRLVKPRGFEAFLLRKGQENKGEQETVTEKQVQRPGSPFPSDDD